MTSLRHDLRAALAALYPNARFESLVADASTRRFHRMFLDGGRTLVIMDYGAPFQGETDDVRLARVFERASLPVARVLEVLPEAGALVLEDLGDQTLETALAGADPATRRGLYEAAVGLAARIATRGTDALAASDRARGPALDSERFLFEMRFFLEHYVGAFLGRPEVALDLRQPLEELALTTAAHPRVLCHRDFHSRNIMVGSGGMLAMVDIQDARWGPDTYDLASLLRDAYVDLDEKEVEAFFDSFVRQLAVVPDARQLRSRFDLVATQRMIKALGTFGYQVAVIGNDRYRIAIPRTLARLSKLMPLSTQTCDLAKEMTRSGILPRSEAE